MLGCEFFFISVVQLKNLELAQQMAAQTILSKHTGHALVHVPNPHSQTPHGCDTTAANQVHALHTCANGCVSRVLGQRCNCDSYSSQIYRLLCNPLNTRPPINHVSASLIASLLHSFASFCLLFKDAAYNCKKKKKKCVERPC